VAVKYNAVKYYVLQGDQNHELTDDASLIAFLDADNKIEGEFSADDYAGLKIKYNKYTGAVSINPTFSTNNVTLLYSSKAFNIIITPLKNIIDLRNKRDFLLALSKFEVLDISPLIKKHMDDNGNFTRKLSINDVDDTLLKVQNLARTEGLHDFYEIVGGKEIVNIKSKKEADVILNKLKDCFSKDNKANKNKI
jgi:hypothetical protein